MFSIEVYYNNKSDPGEEYVAVIKNNLYKSRINNGYDTVLFYLISFKKNRLNVIEENTQDNELYRISYVDNGKFKRIILTHDDLVSDVIKKIIVDTHFSDDIIRHLLKTKHVYHE